MKKLLAAVTFMAIMAAGAAFAAPEYTIKVGYIGSDTHPTMQAMKVFAKDVDAGSKGKIKVELYPNAQLGGDRELCEGVQMGTIQMAIPSTSALAGFDKRIQVLDLPYLFTTRKAAFDAVDGELGQKLNTYLSKKGFEVLGYQENGFRHVTNSKRPIKTPADLKGLKIRTMENPMHIAFFKELGANPTPMSWGELYTALQQGTVDAEENPYAMIDDGKFYEVQKYVSETGHVFSYEILIANKKFMDKLPADLRKVVVDAAHKAIMTQRASLEKEEAAFKAKVTKAGLTANELTPEQKKPFVDATKKVYAQFENELGKEIMDIARKVQK
ncbi:TRAP transporter substrate-binding protein [Cloacibacillus porcorum]|uniref:TRAP transporter substrate-binding protein n=4 Tax=Cloacibacillus TaxID=508459 RepID=UPI0023F27FEE|nr:DctP family TRAP transporter solute-binding subunit [Cloacibacillus porcorum]MDD7648280.1 DctP family TRAP transporter solute-binding subunit [Cloacibacillus porcorum]MDY4092287.1 DctP family TRAP transporter solute-binding subunit [Cloacibacillus porcorum]